MALAMPVVWSDRHRLHDPGGEVWVGVRIAGHRAARARRRDPRGARRGDGARFVEAEPQPDDAVLAVHDARAGRVPRRRVGRVGGRRAARDPGQDRVVPYVFAAPRAAQRPRPAVPAAPSARAGYFAYDTMTLIGPGTWEAARAAVDVGASPPPTSSLDGAPAAYALLPPARPPRHARRASAAPATSTTRRPRPPRPARARSTARSRSSTSTPTTATARRRSSTTTPTCSSGSVHVDPGAGWFPHFLGFADETAPAARRQPQRPAGAGGGRRRVARGGARARGVGAAAPARSSSRSASTPPAATRRARSR